MPSELAVTVKADTALLEPISRGVGRLENQVEVVHDEAMQRRHDAIVNFLSQYDFSKKYRDVISWREPGTGQWFIEAPRFKSWIHEHSATLWCPGIPGAGKTTLMSTAVDHLQQSFASSSSSFSSSQKEQVAVLYAFCDYRESDIQTPSTLISSLWRQLMKRRLLSPAECLTLENSHVVRDIRPTLEEMQNILHSEIRRYRRVYVLIDAMDELDLKHRTELLNVLFKLRADINFLVTSRYLGDETGRLDQMPQLPIRADDADLHRYISGRLKNETRLYGNIKKDPTLADIIKRILSQKSQGM
jgi:Cdc6-like AAA superfamily ATPase